MEIPGLLMESTLDLFTDCEIRKLSLHCFNSSSGDYFRHNVQLSEHIADTWK